MQAELERGHRRRRRTRRDAVTRDRVRASGELTYRPVRPDELRRVRRDLARVDQRLHPAGSASPRSRRDRPAPAPLRPPLGDRPGAVRRRRRAPTPRPARSGSSRSPRRVVRERLWFLSMLFVAARASRRPASDGRCWPACMPAADDGHGPMATATDSAQPISNALYAQLRDRAADPAAQPDRPARAARRVRAAARRGSRRSRSRRSPAARPTATATGALADAVDALDRELLGRRAPDRPPLPAARSRGAAGSTAARTAPPLGYGYATEAGRVGPVAVRDAGAAARRSSATSRRPSSRAARSRCGCRGLPIARSWPRCGPGSASTSSRSCCAGTGRSRTSTATCRSRPACSRSEPAPSPDRTGPDHRPVRWYPLVTFAGARGRW